MERTLQQYDNRVKTCRQIFLDKTADYGTAWRILRPSSLTDQIYIKAKRIRSIELTGQQQIEDSIESEYIGIVNYSIMALIQLQLGIEDQFELDVDQAVALYDKEVETTRQLMIAKNTDYGEVWREMRMPSFTDFILMKLLRVKQIEGNDGQTRISEGIDANYRDMINYALFALIKIKESTS